MSLHLAKDADGNTLGRPPGPIPCVDLIPLVEVEFDLPCEDPWLVEAGTSGHAYLEAARRGWDDHPDWMDFLDMHSPVYDLKRAERDLYLHEWKPWLGAKRVLDVGCGIGRMTHPFLDRGATVVGVDGDIGSLRRCAWHAAGRGGALDLHWSSARRLPEEGDFDVVVSCEVLCYVPEAAEVLAQIARRLRPGGALLLSWEAPWGWATAEDAPSGALDHALRGAGVIDLPGDRWVRTVDRAELAGLLEGAGLEVRAIQPTHYGPDGPLERCLDLDLDLERLLAVERACRNHPVWAPLHRIWTATAVRPD